MPRAHDLPSATATVVVYSSNQIKWLQLTDNLDYATLILNIEGNVTIATIKAMLSASNQQVWQCAIVNITGPIAQTDPR